MKKIFFIIVVLLISQNAQSSELMLANQKLPQDSLVFSVEEAQKMQKYIADLEAENKKNQELLQNYQELIKISNEESQELKIYLQEKDQIIARYIEIQKLDQQRIEYLNKLNKNKGLEKIGIFSGGVLLTFGLFLAADSIDDKIDDRSVGK